MNQTSDIPLGNGGFRDDIHEKVGLLQDDDLEQQIVVEQRKETEQSKPAESLVPNSLKLPMLGLYFALNLGLTIYNKAVLGSFKFPWLLTALHSASAAFGCFVLLQMGYYKLTRLRSREHIVLIAFSFLFTINIAISNVSLAMVSVPFHQIARSTCPIATILIYRWGFGRTYSTNTYLTLVPVVLGVALTTYGDYYFTIIGASLTFLGVLLASLKTVATNVLLTGNLALPVLEILLRMSPLAAVQSLIYAYITGELNDVYVFAMNGYFTNKLIWALLGNGAMAFMLNFISFQSNKLAGALTLTVCANIKQSLTVLLGVVLFNVHVGVVNGAGMMITLLGAAAYSKVELDNKTKKKPVPVIITSEKL